MDIEVGYSTNANYLENLKHMNNHLLKEESKKRFLIVLCDKFLQRIRDEFSDYESEMNKLKNQLGIRSKMFYISKIEQILMNFMPIF